MSWIKILLLIFMAGTLSGRCQAAEDVVKVRGTEEDLHRAIDERMRPSMGSAAFGTAGEPQASSGEKAAPSRSLPPGGEAKLVPAEDSQPAGDSVTGSYDRQLELSPHPPFSRNLDEHGTFDDELDHSTLKEIRDDHPRSGS